MWLRIAEAFFDSLWTARASGECVFRPMVTRYGRGKIWTVEPIPAMTVRRRPVCIGLKETIFPRGEKSFPRAFGVIPFPARPILAALLSCLCSITFAIR